MRYRVTAPLTIHPGALLELTPEQVARRLWALAVQPCGLHRVVLPVSFKAGEELGLDGDLPKTHASAVETVELNQAAPVTKTAQPVAAKRAQRVVRGH